jgi:hypothetical protein
MASNSVLFMPRFYGPDDSASTYSRQLRPQFAIGSSPIADLDYPFRSAIGKLPIAN